MLQSLPLRGKQAELQRAARGAARARPNGRCRYVELYGAYAECEAVYGVDRLLALCGSRSTRTSATRSGSTRASSTGTTTSATSTCRRSCSTRVSAPLPASRTVENRERPAAPPGAVARPAPRRVRPREHAHRVERRRVVRVARDPPPAEPTTGCGSSRGRWRRRPRLLALDRRDRGDFLRYFYRRYEDAPIDQLDADSVEMFSDLIITKSFPAAIRRVREHRALGHRTLLITGALDFVVAPLRPLFDDVVCASLAPTASGRYAGELTDVPPTGESRAQALFDYADAEGMSLAESVAYADSASDLPMLEAVGFPVAVNPETRLAAIARKRGWLVEQFAKAAGGPRQAPADRAADAGGADEGARVRTQGRARTPRPRWPGGSRREWARPSGRCPLARCRRAASCRRTAGCGCDLGSPASAAPISPRIDGHSSRYFEPIVSFPFTPGHEVVGDLDDGTPGRA